VKQLENLEFNLRLLQNLDNLEFNLRLLKNLDKREFSPRLLQNLDNQGREKEPSLELSPTRPTARCSQPEPEPEPYMNSWN
jgi:hypothetical protein